MKLLYFCRLKWVLNYNEGFNRTSQETSEERYTYSNNLQYTYMQHAEHIYQQSRKCLKASFTELSGN